MAEEKRKIKLKIKKSATTLDKKEPKKEATQSSRSFVKRDNRSVQSDSNHRNDSNHKNFANKKPSVAAKPNDTTKKTETGRTNTSPAKKQQSYNKSSNYNKRGKFSSAREKEKIALSKLAVNMKQKNKEKDIAIPSEIEIEPMITLSNLAKKMNIKAGTLIHKFMDLGMMITINDKIDSDTASIVASEYNCEVKVFDARQNIVLPDPVINEAMVKPRFPIVTVMGHVDHGKTQLLDSIRHTDVIGKESGGITQHIGAYTVKTKKGSITFIDTPGHAAFTEMRSRGAAVTDIVILVVSATEGPKPQTIEAINHAKAANVPIVVALNKIDLPDANPEKVKQQLSEYGIVSEEWGGEHQFVPISALTKQGIPELLDAVLLQAELLDLKADPTTQAVGYVIESKMDIGKGAIATIIITQGTLKIGDFFLSGTSYGKVRALLNSKKKRVKIAPPGTPIVVMGFQSLPEAGDDFRVLEDQNLARDIALKRSVFKEIDKEAFDKKQQKERMKEAVESPGMKELNVILKADVHGSQEAIKTALSKMKNEEIRVDVIHSAVGAVTENDVLLASATQRTSDYDVLIVSFKAQIDNLAKQKAELMGIKIKRYNIIYDLIEDIRKYAEGMLESEVSEEVIGTAQVLEIFKISNVGKIAGCLVQKGFMRKNENVRIYRNEAEIWSGKIKELKREKNTTNEVQEGFECGISFENFEDFKKGDVIECYSISTTDKTFVIGG